MEQIESSDEDSVYLTASDDEPDSGNIIMYSTKIGATWLKHMESFCMISFKKFILSCGSFEFKITSEIIYSKAVTFFIKIQK